MDVGFRYFYQFTQLSIFRTSCHGPTIIYVTFTADNCIIGVETTYERVNGKEKSFGGEYFIRL